MTILSSAKHGKFVLKFLDTGSANTEELTVGDEVITGLTITSVLWCGTWTVSRGANTVLELIDGGSWPMADDYCLSIEEFKTASDITCTMTSETGTIIISGQKETAPHQPYGYNGGD